VALAIYGNTIDYMHGNLELLVIILNVITTVALVGLLPFTLRRLNDLRRQQRYLMTLVYRLMDNQRLNKSSADDLSPKNL
jgi:hypothetical protein